MFLVFSVIGELLLVFSRGPGILEIMNCMMHCPSFKWHLNDLLDIYVGKAGYNFLSHVGLICSDFFPEIQPIGQLKGSRTLVC